MPTFLAVLVFFVAPICSSHVAASSSSSHAHRTPTLRWQQRGVRALLQTPVTVNSYNNNNNNNNNASPGSGGSPSNNNNQNNNGGNATSYSTSVAPSGAVIVNVYNNNNNNNNNAGSPTNNNNNNNNGNSSPSGSGSVVPLAINGNSPSPDNSGGNTGALPSGAPPVQQGTTVSQGSSSQCDVNGPNCCSDQGQNSRLLPVNSGASLASIANSIFDSVPPGATYTPPASASSGTGGSTSGGGRISVNSGARSLDTFEAAVLALNLPASSSGVNYQFSQGSYICVPNLYSSSGAPVLVQPAVYSSAFHAGGTGYGGQNTYSGQTTYGGQNVYGGQGAYDQSGYGQDTHGQGAYGNGNRRGYPG